MSYSSTALANAFIQKAKNGQLPALTPMKLQKLMFFAQSWYVHHCGTSLIDDVFCRWCYGPVIPSLYHKFKPYGASPILDYDRRWNPDPSSPWVATVPIIPENDHRAWRVVDEVIRVYGKFSGSQLSDMTQRHGTAWSLGKADGSPITNNEIMRQDFHELSHS